MTRGAVMVALATATALLSGCAPAAPPAAEPPPTSSPPIFASDEEALAAAEAAYARYLAVSDQIAQDGGKNPERIDAVVTERFLPRAMEQLMEFSTAGLHALGNTRATSHSLINYVPDDAVGASITFYTCVDVGQVDVLDDSGKSVVSTERPNVSPFEIRVVARSPEQVAVDSEEYWQGVNFCEVD